jgi:cytochrome c-type protein NapC
MPLGTLVIGIALGAALLGGFSWTMEATNTEAFCLSCHEMKDYVYPRYRESTHASNRSGVRATCPDCHVPEQWTSKIVRKVRSTKDLYHTLIGSIDTPEKYEAKRLAMARKVWDEMKESDSRECRHCHDPASMNPEKQDPLAWESHAAAPEMEMTCIECHEGVAHGPYEASEQAE